MRLRLINCDVDFQLKIKSWVPYNTENSEADNWTQTEFYLKGDYIDYTFDREVLMSAEVDTLKESLGALLDGNLQEDTEISFVEPDLSFKLFPRSVLVEMHVNFWCSGGLGTNCFSMTFVQEEIEAFYTYLRMVTGELRFDDSEIKTLLHKGILLPE